MPEAPADKAPPPHRISHVTEYHIWEMVNLDQPPDVPMDSGGRRFLEKVEQFKALCQLEDYSPQFLLGTIKGGYELFHENIQSHVAHQIWRLKKHLEEHPLPETAIGGNGLAALEEDGRRLNQGRNIIERLRYIKQLAEASPFKPKEVIDQKKLLAAARPIAERLWKDIKRQFGDENVGWTQRRTPDWLRHAKQRLLQIKLIVDATGLSLKEMGIDQKELGKIFLDELASPLWDEFEKKTGSNLEGGHLMDLMNLVGLKVTNLPDKLQKEWREVFTAKAKREWEALKKDPMRKEPDFNIRLQWLVIQWYLEHGNLDKSDIAETEEDKNLWDKLETLYSPPPNPDKVSAVLEMDKGITRRIYEGIVAAVTPENAAGLAASIALSAPYLGTIAIYASPLRWIAIGTGLVVLAKKTLKLFQNT